MLGVSLELNPDLSEKDNCQVLDNLAMHRPETVLFVDWAKVAEIPAFSLPEAVALSLGLNPEYAYLPWAKEFLVLLKKNAVRNAEHRKVFLEMMKEDGNQEALKYEQSISELIHRHLDLFAEIEKKLSEFIDRLHIAEKNCPPEGTLKPKKDSKLFDLIDLSELARKRNWQLPPEYPSKKKKFSGTTDQSTTTLERHTMLKIIIGMAIKGYTYDPKSARGNAVKEIVSDLAAVGVPVGDDTVRKYLQEAEDFLPE